MTTPHELSLEKSFACRAEAQADPLTNGAKGFSSKESRHSPPSHKGSSKHKAPSVEYSPIEAPGNNWGTPLPPPSDSPSAQGMPNGANGQQLGYSPYFAQYQQHLLMWMQHQHVQQQQQMMVMQAQREAQKAQKQRIKAEKQQQQQQQKKLEEDIPTPFFQPKKSSSMEL